MGAKSTNEALPAENPKAGVSLLNLQSNSGELTLIDNSH